MQLIEGEELGERIPMQLLRRMQQLFGDNLGLNSNTFSKTTLPPTATLYCPNGSRLH